MAKDDAAKSAEETVEGVVEEVTEVEIIEDQMGPGVTSRIVVDSLSAAQSIIGTATAGEVDASTCLIGGMSVAGDADVSMGAVGVMLAKQNVDFRQGWVNNVFSSGDVSIAQAGNGFTLGRSATLDHAGSVAVVAGDATVSHGWVGLMLAGKTEVSEDSRVIIGTKAAIIIAAALLGGFAVVAIALMYGSGKVARQWNPKALGEWAKHKVPAEWGKHGTPAEWIERIRKAAAA